MKRETRMTTKTSLPPKTIVSATSRPAAQTTTPAAQPADTKTYTLRHPITVEGKTITVVTLRRPKARDMIKIADALPILAAMTEMVQAAFAAHGGDESAAGMLIAKEMKGETF